MRAVHWSFLNEGRQDGTCSADVSSQLESLQSCNKMMQLFFYNSHNFIQLESVQNDIFRKWKYLLASGNCAAVMHMPTKFKHELTFFKNYFSKFRLHLRLILEIRNLLFPANKISHFCFVPTTQKVIITATDFVVYNLIRSIKVIK